MIFNFLIMNIVINNHLEHNIQNGLQAVSRKA